MQISYDIQDLDWYIHTYTMTDISKTTPKSTIEKIT